MAESKRILVSLPNTLLDEVDVFVNQAGISRSALIREAMQEYISHRKRKEKEELLKQGYMLMGEINLKWAEMCFEADNLMQLEYEEKLSECE
ncbi:MAG: ribbon-helix-helix protein, CopG family [Clostridiaceae bacterium]|nr:ribbon-helix-helix protein, CopG family [Clostridiaceae bacterium]